MKKLFIFIGLLIISFIFISTTMLAIGLIIPIFSSLFHGNDFLDILGKFNIFIYPYIVGISILVSWSYFIYYLLFDKKKSIFLPLLGPVINILFTIFIIIIKIVLEK